jgi:hypothetical protein
MTGSMPDALRGARDRGGGYHEWADFDAFLAELVEDRAALITFRDDLRARLRQAGHAGVPVLTEATAMIASYLAAERDLGRIAADADVGTLAPTIIGAGHLVFADVTPESPPAGDVRKVVTAVLAGVTPDPPPRREDPGTSAGTTGPEAVSGC